MEVTRAPKTLEVLCLIHPAPKAGLEGRPGESVLPAQHLQSLDPAFLFRVRRAYRLALKAEPERLGREWRRIERHQASIHAALMAETDDELRRIFADPISSDLYYGVDNLSRTLLGTNFATEPTIAAFSNQARNDLFRLARSVNAPQAADKSSFNVEGFLDYLDSLLNQPVEFPNLFRGELGLTTRRGVASYRAIQALYQSWRLLQLFSFCGEKSIVEVGPGMGRTAYYAFRAGVTDYTTIDLPLGMVGQACFLGAALGPEKICLPGDDDNLGRERIKLLFAGANPARTFSVALNADSLTEMPLNTARKYVVWIKRNTSFFMSINHGQNLFSVTEIAAEAGLRHSATRPYPMREGYLEEVFDFSNCATPADGMRVFLSHRGLRLKVLVRFALRAFRKLGRIWFSTQHPATS